MRGKHRSEQDRFVRQDHRPDRDRRTGRTSGSLTTEESEVPPIRAVVELDEALEPAIAVNSPVTVVANMTVRQIEAEVRAGAHELRSSAAPPASGPLLYVL